MRGADDCRGRSTDGVLVVRLWDEARKALLTSQLSSSELLTAEWTEYRRSLDPTDGTIRQQRLTNSRNATQHDFRSAPPEQLANVGYVVTDREGMVSHAPDVDVLLSESLAGTHCFHVELATADRAEMVGIGFTPMLNRRDVSDIAGIFWMDRATSELPSLEFRYTNLPRSVARTNTGGIVEFIRLPTGGWLVSRWHMRLPQLEVTGGEVTEVLRGDTELFRASRGSLLVQVLSRDSSIATNGVTIAFVGTDYFARTDVNGRATVSSMIEGRYHARVQTPLMDSIGVAPLLRDLVVPVGATSVDTIFVPTVTTARSAISDNASDVVASTAATVDIAVTSANRLPVSDALIDVRVGRAPSRVVRTDVNGRALLAGLPAGRLRVYARALGFKAGELLVEVAPGRNTIPIVLDAARVCPRWTPCASSVTSRCLRDMQRWRHVAVVAMRRRVSHARTSSNGVR